MKKIKNRIVDDFWINMIHLIIFIRLYALYLVNLYSLDP